MITRSFNSCSYGIAINQLN